MRLIDADALKDWIDEYVSVFKKSDTREIKGYIEHQPTIEPKTKVVAQVTFDEDELREIVHEAVERFKEEYEIADRSQGEWLKFGLGRGTRILFCTNCERKIEVPLSQGDSNYDFCPNCGARMKGADDE